MVQFDNHHPSTRFSARLVEKKKKKKKGIHPHLSQRTRLEARRIKVGVGFKEERWVLRTRGAPGTATSPCVTINLHIIQSITCIQHLTTLPSSPPMVIKGLRDRDGGQDSLQHTVIRQDLPRGLPLLYSKLPLAVITVLPIVMPTVLFWFLYTSTISSVHRLSSIYPPVHRLLP